MAWLEAVLLTQTSMPWLQDVAFWTSSMYTENNLCEIVRTVAGDLVEETKLIDDFTHPKTVSYSLLLMLWRPNSPETDKHSKESQTRTGGTKSGKTAFSKLVLRAYLNNPSAVGLFMSDFLCNTAWAGMCLGEAVTSHFC